MAYSIMKIYIFLGLFVGFSPIFGLSVLTGSESQNSTYSEETVREVKNFDVLRQLLNQETLIRMSMAKDMLSLKQIVSTLKQVTVELKKDMQKLEGENKRLSSENVKCSENVNLVLGNSDELNKTIDKLRDEFKQSKQKLSSAVSSLEVLQTNISFLGDISALKQTTVGLKKDLQKLKRENEHLSNENVKCGENVNLFLGKSDEMNKTIDKLQNELNQSKQNLSSVVSSLDLKISKNTRDITREVAFTVGVKSSDSSWNSGTLVFPRVVYNVGGGYDPNTGVFTAPVNGHFVFFVNVQSYSSSAVATYLVLNGAAKVRTLAYDHSYSSGPNLAVLKLQKGDRVWVRHYGGLGYYTQGDAPLTTFSGFLI